MLCVASFAIAKEEVIISFNYFDKNMTTIKNKLITVWTKFGRFGWWRFSWFRTRWGNSSWNWRRTIGKLYHFFPN